MTHHRRLDSSFFTKHSRFVKESSEKDAKIMFKHAAHYRWLMISLLLTSLPLTHGSETIAIMAAKQVILNTDLSLKHWRYRSEVITPDERKQILYTPVGDKHQRQLLTVNNQPATDAQIKAYNDKFKERQGQIPKLSEVVRMETLSLIKTDAQSWTFQFYPNLDNMEKHSKRFKGELVINKEGPYLSRLTVNNTESFRVNLAFKLKKFHLELICQKHNQHTLPQSLRIEFQGKAMMVKKVNQSMIAQFDTFKWEPPTP